MLYMVYLKFRPLFLVSIVQLSEWLCHTMLIVIWWRRRCRQPPVSNERRNKMGKKRVLRTWWSLQCFAFKTDRYSRYTVQLINLTVFYERITKNCTYLLNEPKQCRNSIFDFNLPPEEMDDFFICFYLLAVAAVMLLLLLLLPFVENSMSPTIEFCRTFTLTIYYSHL